MVSKKLLVVALFVVVALSCQAVLAEDAKNADTPSALSSIAFKLAKRGLKANNNNNGKDDLDPDDIDPNDGGDDLLNDLEKLDDKKLNEISKGYRSLAAEEHAQHPAPIHPRPLPPHDRPLRHNVDAIHAPFRRHTGPVRFPPSIQDEERRLAGRLRYPPSIQDEERRLQWLRNRVSPEEYRRLANVDRQMYLRNHMVSHQQQQERLREAHRFHHPVHDDAPIHFHRQPIEGY